MHDDHIIILGFICNIHREPVVAPPVAAPIAAQKSKQSLPEYKVSELGNDLWKREKTDKSPFFLSYR